MWDVGCGMWDVGNKTNIKNETRGGGSSETFFMDFYIFLKGSQKQAKVFSIILSRCSRYSHCVRLRRQI